MCCVLSCFSHVQLFATPRTVACQAPLSMGLSRQDYWSGLPFPFPGDLPNPGIEPGSPALQADSLPSEPQGGFPLSQYHKYPSVSTISRIKILFSDLKSTFLVFKSQQSRLILSKYPFSHPSASVFLDVTKVPCACSISPLLLCLFVFYFFQP